MIYKTIKRFLSSIESSPKDWSHCLQFLLVSYAIFNRNNEQTGGFVYETYRSRLVFQRFFLSRDPFIKTTSHKHEGEPAEHHSKALSDSRLRMF